MSETVNSKNGAEYCVLCNLEDHDFNRAHDLHINKSVTVSRPETAYQYFIDMVGAIRAKLFFFLCAKRKGASFITARHSNESDRIYGLFLYQLFL